MLADPGSYEERYRLTGAALGLASVLLSVGLGFLWHTNLIFAALAVLAAIPAVLVIARRPVAFRADHAGITLAPDRPLPHRRAVFIPWADVEQIVLYPGRKAAGFGDYLWASAEVEYIGVQRRREPRPCPTATSRLPAAQCLASRPGPPGGSKTGDSTASDSPPSLPRWRPESPSSKPGNTPSPARRIEGPGPRQDWHPRGV